MLSFDYCLGVVRFFQGVFEGHGCSRGYCRFLGSRLMVNYGYEFGDRVMVMGYGFYKEF